MASSDMSGLSVSGTCGDRLSPQCVNGAGTSSRIRKNFSGHENHPLRRGRPTADLDPQPGPSIGPGALRSGVRESEGLSGLRKSQPGEVEELDQLGLDWVAGGEAGQCLVQRQQVGLGLG